MRRDGDPTCLDNQCKREAKVLRLLETLRMYSDLLSDVAAAAGSGNPDQSGSGFRMEVANSDEEKECDEHESVEALRRCLANCFPVRVRVTRSRGDSSSDRRDIIVCGENL